MQLTPEELALANFKQIIPVWFGSRYYMSKEKAYERLKQLSGLDFGDDVTAWET